MTKNIQHNMKHTAALSLTRIIKSLCVSGCAFWGRGWGMCMCVWRGGWGHNDEPSWCVFLWLCCILIHRHSYIYNKSKHYTVIPPTTLHYQEEKCGVIIIIYYSGRQTYSYWCNPSTLTRLRTRRSLVRNMMTMVGTILRKFPFLLKILPFKAKV